MFPRIFFIPDTLEDPTTGEMYSTRREGMPQGRLVLKTSKVSMRHSLKPRHHIVFIASGRPVAFMVMEDVSRSIWVDRMYGECFLDVLVEYETPDRTQLAEAPITRALRSWVKDRVLEYDAVPLCRRSTSMGRLYETSCQRSQVYGELSSTAEVKAGQKYLNDIVASLRADSIEVETEVCHSLNPKREIIRYALRIKPDLLIMGAHGHGRLGDLIFGDTINPVRHQLNVPILVVRDPRK